MAEYEYDLKSCFHRATGDRHWHANVTSPRPEAFREMELRVAARGENTTRFFNYSIKTESVGAGRHFSFTFQDGGESPFDGSGDEITLFCTLTYDVPK